MPVTVERYDTMAEEEVLNGRYTPEEASERVAERVNAQIQRNLRESASLRKRHETLMQRQGQIDERRLAGRPVPEEWLLNPFHRAWYRRHGMLDTQEAP